MARKNPITNQDISEVQDTPEELKAPSSAKVRAVFNKMRNPYTGAVFLPNKVTDVIDLDSADNTWTRFQLAAKVLEIV